MLDLVIPETEMYDEQKEEFVYSKGATLQLEHSLISISKWEAKTKKPFLGKEAKTREEEIEYIRCMTINARSVDPSVYTALTNKHLQIVRDYIDDKQTATWFTKRNTNTTSNGRIITSEQVYSWMVSLGIPFETEKWNFNRLLTLIRIVEVNNQPPKKMSRNEASKWQRGENARRRARMGTRG